MGSRISLLTRVMLVAVYDAVNAISKLATFDTLWIRRGAFLGIEVYLFFATNHFLLVL
jgi:hypothetical protein